MVRFYHNKKIIDGQNNCLQTVFFVKQQLPKNNIDNYKIYNISKPIKE